MFELFKNPQIDFMGKRRLWGGISIALVVASLVAIPVFGIKRGIELGGGAEVQVKYAATPDLGAIRSALGAAGFDSHLVTTIGPPSDNEVYIRLGLPPEAKGEDITPRVVAALEPADRKAKAAAGQLDLNTADTPTLKTLFLESPDLTREQAEQAATAIGEARKDRAIFRSSEELSGLLPGPALEILRQKTFAGPFAVRGQSFIGPSIGKELIRKAAWAILGSLGGMLVYIWIRFQLEWGVAAVVALVHDTIITFGLFTIAGFEISLPVVASFLTLIGYSVNDKVVVFDRMRENVRLRGSSDMLKLINDSMNQALSRTVLTSVLTWIATIALFALGGPALRDFSFPLMIGIVVGTYSSIYIAAPVLLLWQRHIGRKAAATEKKGDAGASRPRPAARKVRSSR